MIGIADEFVVVAAISQVIIDWNEEVARMTDEQVKLDPDMPPLKDAFDNDLGIIIPDASSIGAGITSALHL
ncbi:hypothetical protein NL676_039859 [Syzygium grande]|nr:hypothetical protein NL676_039859 [Syzygium grande]